MRFEDVLGNGKLWSVVYGTDKEDVLTKTLSNWISPGFLSAFFADNKEDLANYFHVTNIDHAIFDTVADAVSLSCLILDIRPEANLDPLFRPLENQRSHEMVLSKEKAKGKRISGHASWLRIYAIKLEDGIYLVTGGAIKLTPTMAERQHTLDELVRMEKVRNYLIDNGVADVDGLSDISK